MPNNTMTVKQAVTQLYKAREAIDALLAAYERKESGSTVRPAKKTTPKKFVAPTMHEWVTYAKTLEPYFDPLDAEGAYDHYVAKGWRIGKDPMKDWQASCRQCHRRYIKDKPGVTTRNDASISSLRTRLKVFKDRNQGPHSTFWDFLSPAEIEECKAVIQKIKDLEQ